MLKNKPRFVDKSKITLDTENEPEIEMALNPGLIIHGAGSTKIGFGGEKFPRFVYPEQSTKLDSRLKRFPLEGSKPTNLELLKAYWEASIKQLKIDPQKNPILISLPTAIITECPFRDLVLDHFYNQLLIEKLAVVSDPFLALVAFQSKLHKLNAIIIDIGFSQIRIVPIYQASVLEEHLTQISFGGFDLTLQLGNWLQQQGYEGPIDARFIQDIKENYCYVRPYNSTIEQNEEKVINYSFDKYNFKLGHERWKLPELFFHKKFFSQKIVNCPRSDFEENKYNLKELTLSKAIVYVIKSLNNILWKDFCKNICLTGGGTKFIGLKARLEEEVKNLFPEYSKYIQIYDSPNPDLIPFIGASKLSKLMTFQEFWRTKEFYETSIYDLYL